MATKQIIVVRRDLRMRRGRLAAQVAHASMKFLVDNDESEQHDRLEINLTADEIEWLTGLLDGRGCMPIVVGVDSEGELKDLVLRAQLSDVEVHAVFDRTVIDSIDTQTMACAAFGPAREEILDEITGHLRVL